SARIRRCHHHRGGPTHQGAGTDRRPRDRRMVDRRGRRTLAGQRLRPRQALHHRWSLHHGPRPRAGPPRHSDTRHRPPVGNEPLRTGAAGLPQCHPAADRHPPPRRVPQPLLRNDGLGRIGEDPCSPFGLRTSPRRADGRTRWRRDPDSAWMRALRDLQDRADADPETRAKAAATAHTIDRLIRLAPPVIDNDLIDIMTLHPALDWLGSRLRSLEHQPDETTSTRFITEATTHLNSFREALVQLPAEQLRVRELFDIADACAPAAPHTTAEAVAADWTVVSEPSEVPDDCETILWWSSCRT